jgi:hypothetical protein
MEKGIRLKKLLCPSIPRFKFSLFHMKSLRKEGLAGRVVAPPLSVRVLELSISLDSLAGHFE